MNIHNIRGIQPDFTDKVHKPRAFGLDRGRRRILMRLCAESVHQIFFSAARLERGKQLLCMLCIESDDDEVNLQKSFCAHWLMATCRSVRLQVVQSGRLSKDCYTYLTVCKLCRQKPCLNLHGRTKNTPIRTAVLFSGCFLRKNRILDYGIYEMIRNCKRLFTGLAISILQE